MADESEDGGTKPDASAEPVAIAAALGPDTPEARDYLRRQSRLTYLQFAATSSLFLTPLEKLELARTKALHD